MDFSRQEYAKPVPQNSFLEHWDRAFQKGCIINWDGKKPSCFPVILFYQNTLPSHFYDTVLFLPDSTSLPINSNACPKELLDPLWGYLLPSPTNCLHPKFSLLILRKFILWGTTPGTIISWPLLTRYYPREAKKRGIPTCREGSLCIQWKYKGFRAYTLGLPQRKWNWGLWTRVKPGSLLVSSGFFIHDI